MKLGRNQIGVLKSLASHGVTGEWQYGRAGWYWNTLGGTVTILESLVKYGLVEKIGANHYRITLQGRKVAKESGW